MDVHLRDLRYFVAVAEELHFTRAAEQLHISQPSLSKQIRVLERDLGFPLFRRDRRTVALTDAGEALLPLARELLGGWDRALAETTERARAAAGVLRDYWLAVDERDGRPIRIGAVAETPDETFEAVAAMQGVALLSAGNAALYSRPGIVTRPLPDLSPAELAIAWRASDERPVIQEFAAAAQHAVTICPVPETSTA